MLARIYAPLRARRAAVLHAEALIGYHDQVGLQHAMDLAADSSLPEAERHYYSRVVAIARKRESLLDVVDTATRYDIINGWRCRRGSGVRW